MFYCLLSTGNHQFSVAEKYINEQNMTAEVMKLQMQHAHLVRIVSTAWMTLSDERVYIPILYRK